MRMLPVLTLIVALLLLFAFPVHAQSPVHEKSLPDAPQPKPFNKKIFWTGVSLLAAAKSADAWTTARVLDGGGWESNLTLGKHPSTPHLAGHAAAMFAGQSAAFYYTERSRRAWIRWTGRALMVFAIEEHTRLAACNSHIDPKSSRVQNCNAVMPF